MLPESRPAWSEGRQIPVSKVPSILGVVCASTHNRPGQSHGKQASQILLHRPSLPFPCWSGKFSAGPTGVSPRTALHEGIKQIEQGRVESAKTVQTAVSASRNSSQQARAAVSLVICMTIGSHNGSRPGSELGSRSGALPRVPRCEDALVLRRRMVVRLVGSDSRSFRTQGRAPDKINRSPRLSSPGP